MTTRSFAVATQGALDEVHARFVALAKSEHSKVMRADPRPDRFTRFVDGVAGAREEAVRPHGVITYVYPRLELVVRYAMEMLFRYSPVLSGAYRNAHTLYLNGRAVPNLLGYRPGDEIVITNFMPYARKIDLGVMKMRVAGTDRTYERAVSATNRKFGKVARAYHAWRGRAGAGVHGLGPGRHNRAEVRYPAIILSEL